MIINAILLVLGFIILIKGADFFVDGSSSVALNLGVSKMLIGLTIVAFGTSLPEFAVSVKSLLLGSTDILLGNVIGSNILNILLILGLSALINTLVVDTNTVKKELPIAIIETLLFSILLSDNLFDLKVNELSRSDGVILVLFFSVFIYYLISMVKKKKEEKTENFMSLKKSLAFSLLGIVSIIYGSNMVVNHSIIIASILGVSKRMIALTVVALGTSLPELVTSLIATIKKEYDIAIGNIVGSNIFNIGVVIGIPVSILGGLSKITFSYVDIAVMLLSVILLFIFSLDCKISKKEGKIFLLIFISYYLYVLFK